MSGWSTLCVCSLWMMRGMVIVSSVGRYGLLWGTTFGTTCSVTNAFTGRQRRTRSNANDNGFRMNPTIVSGRNCRARLRDIRPNFLDTFNTAATGASSQRNGASHTGVRLGAGRGSRPSASMPSTSNGVAGTSSPWGRTNASMKLFSLAVSSGRVTNACVSCSTCSSKLFAECTKPPPASSRY